MSEIALIYTLFPSSAEAERVCKTLLQENLVACANRFAPAISHFRWEGEVQAQEEHPVLLKANLDKAEQARDRLAELHSYDLPAIVMWPATTDAPFAGWIDEQVA